jgi:16S rRNA processing protein RimM
VSTRGRDPSGEATLALGRVTGAHGVRGALRVHLAHTDSQTLRAGLQVILRAPDGRTTGDEVARAAPKPGSDLVRVWLKGVQGREAAEALRGWTLEVRRVDLPSLDEDEFYLADLMGLQVVSARRELGVVTGVTTNNAQDLLVVEHARAEWLLPVLPEFLIEVGSGTLVVDLPEGLLPAELEEGKP